MIAFHFPPLAGSSGIQRTLRFVQHLPELGWEPMVLTAHPRAYASRSDDLMDEVPPGTIVRRAFALDTSKHLALFRRYPGFLARPDRWLSWKWGAVPTGLRLIREYRPAAIWSTYPIATAHLIGAELARRTGVPWIADFRDPMAQDGYPADPQTWDTFRAIEKHALQCAARSVFVAPGAARVYRERYPEVPVERLRVIENGYDEESFTGLALRTPLIQGKVTLLHSGIVYPSERDPIQLFAALRTLAEQGRVGPDTLCLRLRASAHEPYLRKLAIEHRIEGLVDLAPPIPYRDALAEMMRAEALLVMQASNCNEQIPAKIYEYLRARRPIVGLTDPAGDTAALLREAGVEAIAPLDDATEIAGVLARFVDQLRMNGAPLPRIEYVEQASRRSRSRQLATLLDEVSPGS